MAIFKLFSPEARRLVVLAREEVERFNHLTIRPEHFLLAILIQKLPATEQILFDAGINSALLFTTLRNSQNIGRIKFKNASWRTIAFSKRAVKVMNEASPDDSSKEVSVGIFLNVILKEPSKPLKAILNKCRLKK